MRSDLSVAAAMHDLVDALSILDVPMATFVRDDDAGWDDDALLALLDTMAKAAVPIDLAVIPTAMTPTLAVELRRRLDHDPMSMGVHQHGYAHTNHQTQGRKSEFGDERPLEALRQDIEDGRARLRDAFGDRLDDAFTPPWNRLDARTPPVLVRAGIRCLSRDRCAVQRGASSGLFELPVDVDWSRAWREGGLARVARDMATATREQAGEGRPVGLMLHHAAMQADEREALDALLRLMRSTGAVRWSRMATCDKQANG